MKTESEKLQEENILVYDITSTPSSIDLEKVMHYYKEHQVIFWDSYNKGVEPKIINPKGAEFTVIDLEGQEFKQEMV